MSLVQVAARFDPLRFEPDCVFAVQPGPTIAELVERCRPPEWFPVVGHVALRTAVGLAEIMPENWHRVRPKAGTAVAVYALPMGGGGGGGGGGGKNVLATVAALAVLAAATAISGGLLGPAGLGLFGAAFSAGGFGATLAGAAVGVVGSLAISALAPPPVSPNLNSNGAVAGASADIEAQRVAGINGNALSRGAQVPCVVGTMVASPPLLARPYTSFANGDTFAHAIVGMWGRYDIGGVQINGTDVSLVPDLEIEIMQGLPGDPKITVAPNTVIEDRTVGQLSEFKLDRTDTNRVKDVSNVPGNYPIWHYATTDGAADAIKIRVQFPSGLVRNDIVTGNQTAIGVPLRVAMRRIGDAAWINLPEIHFRDPDATVKAITQEIVIDWESRTPNQRQTLNQNFHTYRAFAATGTAGYDWSANAFFQSSPTVFTPENTSIDADGVTFHLADSAFPRGAYEIRMMRGLSYDGASTGPADHPGNLFEASGTTVLFAQRDRVSTMYCETVQTFRREYPLNQSQPLALIAIKGRGLSLESISAAFTSYAPVWTGSSWAPTDSPTANPAAIFRRMLIDYHAVTGKLPASMRDDALLGEWFAHCQARGYTVNAVLAGGTLQDNLQIVAAAGWAVPRYGHSWGVIIERDRSAETPIQMITPLTGRGLQWEKTFESLPHAIAAEFIDASRGYKTRDDVFVYRSGFNAQTATDYQTVNYTGLTSEAAARARAKLDLGQLLYRRTTYKLDIFIDHLMCRRGDLVMLAHDTLGTRYGFARIMSVTKSGATITSVTLDSDFQLSDGPGDLFSYDDLFGRGQLTEQFQDDMFQDDAFGGLGVASGFQDDAFDQDVFGEGWSPRNLFEGSTLTGVAIRHSTGQSITYPVQDPLGGNVITFDPAIADPGTILPGCVLVLGARGMVTRRCIVFDVARNDLETATITLVDEAPRIHQ